MPTALNYLSPAWQEWYLHRRTLEGFFDSRDAFLVEVDRLRRALAGHDADAAAHSERVCRFAMAVADELGLDPSTRDQLRVAATLHDVGKLGIPAAILHKAGDLAPEELAWLRDHVLVGERLVRSLTPAPAVHEAVRWHHERHDGLGYPDGLGGDEIPVLTRILAVAEAFAAMTEAGPSGGALPWADAVGTLHRESGRQFHPEAVADFVAALRRVRPDAEGWSRPALRK